ncbi:FkbM family methyltransferase [Chitinophaga niastensis]|uniref:FkbM family methyltransferase n=1 Tax=Chitinophaga niastensis TaxID=536980 RepID=A0A2P8HFC7_CHINA|nr:FkbM family methyltransferase [Chitinophaga niastensis]PSL44942.1 FkbM family methyltransferase [Chitinophaga niastensis]
MGLISDNLGKIKQVFSNKFYREYFRLYRKHYGQQIQQIAPASFLHYDINIVDGSSFVYQYKEIFFSRVYQFESSNKIPVIFDCGANIGLSCIYFKSLYPEARITAFEADPFIAGVLSSNISKNNLSAITVVAKAVWTNEESITFYSDNADGGNVFGGNAGGTKVNVPTVRLRSMLEQEGTIDFLKMDIEGAEIAVIKDCDGALSGVDNIFIEYHSFNKTPQGLGEILETLQRNGFRYFIESATERAMPFINKATGEVMDMQLNIFAYKI